MTTFDEHRAHELRILVAHGRFAGVSFEDAMKFILTGGIMPADGLPIDSILDLDDWTREVSEREEPRQVFTATQLKNETGTVVAAATKGNRVIITRHGRPLVEITAA